MAFDAAAFEREVNRQRDAIIAAQRAKEPPSKNPPKGKGKGGGAASGSGGGGGGGGLTALLLKKPAIAPSTVPGDLNALPLAYKPVPPNLSGGFDITSSPLGNGNVSEALPSSAPQALSTEAALPQAGTSSILGNFSAMGPGPQAGIILGTALAAKGIADAARGKKDNSPVGLASRAQALASTFGFSELGRLAAPNGIMGILGGKSKVQVDRDRMRKALQGLNVADSNFNISLPDKSTFNIGLDGHALLTNAAGQTRHPYDVDLSDQLSPEAIGAIAPLAALIANSGSSKTANDTAGMLTNAILSNAKSQSDAYSNARSLYERAGLGSQDKIIAALDAIKPQITNEYGAYRNALNNMFNVKTGTTMQTKPPAQLPMPMNSHGMYSRPITQSSAPWLQGLPGGGMAQGIGQQLGQIGQQIFGGGMGAPSNTGNLISALRGMTPGANIDPGFTMNPAQLAQIRASSAFNSPSWATSQAPITQPTSPQLDFQRTISRSPGIDMQGRRIRY